MVDTLILFRLLDRTRLGIFTFAVQNFSCKWKCDGAVARAQDNSTYLPARNASCLTELWRICLFPAQWEKDVQQQGGILMAENVGPQSSRPSYVSNHKRAFILAAAAIVALTGIAFAFFHMGKGSSVEAYETSAATPMAARVDQVDGDVGIAPEFSTQDQRNIDWLKATVNSQASVCGRIIVRDSGKAGIAFGDRSYARLDPGALLDVVTLTDHRTQVALREGSATFDC